jgi:hypothetical protein
MEDCEREMNFEKLLNRFKKLNPNLNINKKISNLQRDLKIIYNLYKEIHKGCGNINDKTKLKNHYNNKENENQIDYLQIFKMTFYNKKNFNFISLNTNNISPLFFRKG